ncbi:MAG: cupredoxin domain-containing protein [Actinomycetota bacterium]
MNASRTGPGSRRMVGRLVGAGIAALGLAACHSSEPAGDVARGPGSRGGAIEVAVDGDQEFAPGVLELDAGEEVTIEVTNDDDSAHDFAIESLELNTGPLEAGEVATATFTVPDDDVEFVCTFHSDMTGRIEIR